MEKEIRGTTIQGIKVASLVEGEVVVPISMIRQIVQEEIAAQAERQEGIKNVAEEVIRILNQENRSAVRSPLNV